MMIFHNLFLLIEKKKNWSKSFVVLFEDLKIFVTLRRHILNIQKSGEHIFLITPIIQTKRKFS